MSIIYFILEGILVGYLAGLVMKGKGFGFFWNLVVGVLGAIMGGMLLGSFFGNGFIGSLITAFLGAVLLLFIIRLFRGR